MRHAAPGDHQDQGGNKRLNFEDRYQYAVPQSRRCQCRALNKTIGRLNPATVIAAVVAPAIAITAPTERSIPPVAITSVIPIANSATGPHG
ncbi:hypothetical protein ECZU45_26290 [Escherichia coli]|nr:hypothetical protein ECZU45_26290 [Escherichia coli]